MYIEVRYRYIHQFYWSQVNNLSQELLKARTPLTLRDYILPSSANGSKNSYFDKVAIDFFNVSRQNMREFNLRNWLKYMYIWLQYTITQCLQNLPVSMKNKTIRKVIAWSNLTAIGIFMLRKWKQAKRKWNYGDAHKQTDQWQ